MSNRRGGIQCTAFPLLEFEADLSSRWYDFEFGTSLVRAEKDMVEAACVEVGFEWFLLMGWTPSDKTIIVGRILGSEEPGREVTLPIEMSFADHFLTALRVIKPNTVKIPSVNKAEAEKGIDRVNSLENLTSDVEGHMFERIYENYKSDIEENWPWWSSESFNESDIEILSKVWPSVARLRGLPSLVETQVGIEGNVNAEVLNAQLDDFVRNMMEERCGVEGMMQSRKRNLKHMAHEYSNRSRVGRAVNWFEKAIYLPRIDAFLSLCVVLETLYTTSENEVTHKLSTRMARILGRGGTHEDRKEYFRRARKLYDSRSRIIHGEIDHVKDGIFEDALVLARESLQVILCNEKVCGGELFPLFASDITEPERSGNKSAAKPLKDFFLRLDLGE